MKIPAFLSSYSSARVLVFASVVMALALGVRQSLSLFLAPMTLVGPLGRESFSLGIGIQNLVWGLSGPLAGWLADRYGTKPVVLGCATAFTAGIAMMALSSTAVGFMFGAGLLAGIGLTGTTFTVLFGAIARAYPGAARARALAIGAALGSVGQVVIVPLAQALVSALGWHQALWGLVGIAALTMPCALGLGGPTQPSVGAAPALAGSGLSSALRDRKYLLVAAGFFACGLQLVFIGTHLAAYLLGCGLTARDGVLALSLIGLFNVAGTFLLGRLAAKIDPSYLLAGVYAARTLFMIAFVLTPISITTVMVFSSAMGLLWLGVGPVMTQLLAIRFGTRHLAALFGGMYLIHQIGSFVGAWIGGRIYEHTGSYSQAWLLCAVVGVIAVVLTAFSGKGPLLPQARHARRLGEAAA
jgi:predicted MFS family arabinose efflux permease